MQIFEDPHQMQESAIQMRSEGKLIALVPTSGALHSGHSRLIHRAQDAADIVVVSAIVNPREFGPNEDYQRFPRNSSGDADLCEREGVDVLFRPSAKVLYPEGCSVSVVEDTISAGLCGVSRPHYFPGVCTLHAKLFNLVRPDSVVMGRRDVQKAAVVRRMIEELSFPVELIMEGIERADDGLALHARNAYLNEFQRTDAATLYRALCKGKELVESGVTNVDRILAEVTHHISQVRRLRVIYVAAVHPETLEPVRSEVERGKTLVMAAVWCDEVRLIDNVIV
jgi:pantoate--beta-alanine ligase